MNEKNIYSYQDLLGTVVEGIIICKLGIRWTYMVKFDGISSRKTFEQHLQNMLIFLFDCDKTYSTNSCM